MTEVTGGAPPAVPKREVVIETLVELADTLVDDFDVVDLFTLLTDRCVQAFNVHEAGLMLALPIGGPLQVMASTSGVMRDVELYELQTMDGPCLDCYQDGQPLLNVSLANSAERWPMFTPRAMEAGFLTVSALPLRLRSTTIGALNLFLTDDTVLGPSDAAAAQAFADIATIAVLHHQEILDFRILNEQLTHALNSRVIVEQAKGMLAERAGLDMSQSFEHLRRYARRSNLRLVDVSQRFIDGTVSLAHLLGSSPPES